MTGGGKLHVKVVNGRNFQNKETFQTSDPYCKLEVGGKSHKTKHVNSNLNPDWNEEFEFDVPNGLDPVISLSIWDKNTIKKDAFMGYSFITFDDCKKDEVTEKKAVMLGGLTGFVTVLVTPRFETSATKIETMVVTIKEHESDGGKEKLKKDVENLAKDKNELQNMNKELQEKLKKALEESSKLSNENTELNKTKEELQKDSELKEHEREKLADANKELIAEIEKLKADVSRLSLEETVTVEMESQLESAPPTGSLDVYEDLKEQNQKLIALKKELLQKLLGFQAVQDLIFNQLKENIYAMETGKGDSEDLRMNLKKQIYGFEQVQALVFRQFDDKMHSFDMTVLRDIEDKVRAFEMS